MAEVLLGSFPQAAFRRLKAALPRLWRVASSAFRGGGRVNCATSSSFLGASGRQPLAGARFVVMDERAGLRSDLALPAVLRLVRCARPGALRALRALAARGADVRPCRCPGIRARAICGRAASCDRGDETWRA